MVQGYNWIRNWPDLPKTQSLSLLNHTIKIRPTVRFN